MSTKPSLSSLSLSERASRAARASVTAATGAAAYLDGLNTEQRLAVETTEGPVLVLAGAGTGKTRALTTRLAHLLATGKVQPWQILCVTFTNKAAREMKERIRGLIGDVVEGLQWSGTFHSIGAQILRRHAEVVGLKSSFTIIDTDDQVRLCKEVIALANLDPKRWTGRGFAAFLDDWKNRGLTPDKVPAGEAGVFGNGKAIELYKAYQARLITLNAADFGDLLVHCLSIFQQQPDILNIYQEKFRYVMVDEYQDTNVAQYLWLRLLAQSHKNICCVGDDDQSIYGWRGAEVTNILNFGKDFPGATIIRLERNYRSTPSILAAASHLIDHNKDRLGKTLWTEVDDIEKVRLRGVWDADEEARSITDDIEAEQSKGRTLSHMAVLVRASFQMRNFEERFNLAGIAYKVVGGPRFYEREETRDALAYLRLVRNIEDDLSFARIINKPRRGFGNMALQTLNMGARRMGVSMAEAGRRLLETNEVKGKAKNSLRGFLEALERWQIEARDRPPGELAEMILEESGYTQFWKNHKSPQAPTKLENLKELVQAASEYDTLPAFLDHVSLVSERSAEATDGQVWLMTLHAAKGLEFPVVFLPGWEDGIFPSQRSLDENGETGLEEERRLAYVGITRAEQSCRISFAANRQVYGRWQSALPSRFIDELPEDHIELLSESGLYGAKASDLPAYSRFDATKAAPDTYYDNPGWKRAQVRQHAQRQQSHKSPAGTPQLEAKASLIASSAPGLSNYKTGERVSHEKFGGGQVIAIEGNKLHIKFDQAGLKKVIDSFVERAE